MKKIDVRFSDPQFAFIDDHKKRKKRRISHEKAVSDLIRRWFKLKKDFELKKDEDVTLEKSRHTISIKLPTAQYFKLKRIATKAKVPMWRVIWQIVTEVASYKKRAYETQDEHGVKTHRVVR